MEELGRREIRALLRQAQDDPSGGDGEGDGAGMDEHDWDGAGEATPEQVQARAQEIDRALRQGEMLAKKRGDGAGNSDGIIGDLLAPKVDWREQLRDFVREQCQGRDESTWRRPNRRYMAQDIYMPSSISERVGELVVGFDTSGSCFSGTVIQKFVAELPAVGSEKANYLKANQFDVTAPDGSQYRIIPGNIATGTPDQWVTTSPPITNQHRSHNSTAEDR
jgi:predicted metal-dependent peptidase